MQNCFLKNGHTEKLRELDLKSLVSATNIMPKSTIDTLVTSKYTKDLKPIYLCTICLKPKSFTQKLGLCKTKQPNKKIRSQADDQFGVEEAVREEDIV